MLWLRPSFIDEEAEAQGGRTITTAFQPVIVYMILFPVCVNWAVRDITALYERLRGYADAHERC